MNIKRLISVSIIAILILGLSGCGNKASKPNENEQTNSSQTQNSQNGQTDVSQQNNTGESQEGSAAGNSTAQNNDQSQSSTSTPPKTQQDALNKIAGALKTKVPLMLPTNVPASEGRYLTAATTSQTWYYKVNLYETTEPSNVNSQAALKGALIATVEGTEYKDTASAKDSINGYEQVDTSNSGMPIIDLGHNIKALGDAGLGHGYLTWNEGLWCIRMDSPNDLTYKNKQYPDSKQLAKDVVAYLENHMLPAPRKIGVISINNWYNSNGTTIEWQYNEMVYKIWSQDPMTALKVAVAMKFK